MAAPGVRAEGNGGLLDRMRGQALLAGLISAALVLGVLIADRLGTRGAATMEAFGTADQTETAEPAAEGMWLSAWTAAPTGALPDHPAGLPDQTVRNVLRPSIGGTALRVEISHRYGDRPLRVTHATVALAENGGPAARPGTLRRLTFKGHGAVSVPAGGAVLSDAAALVVPDGADLLVTVYAPEGAGPVTYHRMARQDSYLAHGDRAGESSGAAFDRTVSDWRYVTAVQLLSPSARGAVAVLGDSLTDGITSTHGGNSRWTDLLAHRLRTEPGAPRYAVLNSGISGNRLLHDAEPDRPFNGAAGTRRLGTDVLPQAGIRTVVVQLGINDLIRDPAGGDASAVVDGLTQLTEDARTAGLRVAGATLAPFEGHQGWSPEREAARQRVNAEIRGGEVFDTVVDLDAALRDPQRPSRLRPAYDSGDGLHPSDAGFAAMAAAVDLSALAEDAAALL
jgi:lysophospholipase L1-like esterase